MFMQILVLRESLDFKIGPIRKRALAWMLFYETILIAKEVKVLSERKILFEPLADVFSDDNTLRDWFGLMAGNSQVPGTKLLCLVEN